jgi:predicted HAD superfamily Cof-like phosphohydrolase
MIHCFEDVKLFQEKFAVPMPSDLTLLNDEAYNFRVGFLQEEKNEFVFSHKENDFVGCIDALLDEVYVACGTSLMMGVDSVLWNDTSIELMVNEDPEVSNTFNINTDEPYPRTPTFLPWDQYNQAVSNMNFQLNKFVNDHYHKDILACTKDMCTLVLTCYDIALRMGLNYLSFMEMWTDVQRANMTKVRATDSSQSKRKTSLDVIKPEGWIGPDGGRILDVRYPGWKERL